MAQPEVGIGDGGLDPSGASRAFIDDPTRFDPIVVEVYEPGINAFIVRDWLGPAFEIHHPINNIPTCKLGIRVTNGWLVNTGTEALPLFKPIEEVLRDDQLVQVRTARGAGRDFVLFRGYVEDVDYDGSRGRTASLLLKQEATTLGEKLDYFIQGQLWVMKRERSQWLGPGGAPGDIHPRIVQALPCIFNPDGAKNCHKRLITWDSPQAYAAQYGPMVQSFKLPVFTHAQDKDAQHWTWGRVFTYLIYWLLKAKIGPGDAGHPGYGIGSWPTTPDGQVIHDRNLYRAIYLRNVLNRDPEQLDGDSGAVEAFERVMSAKPYSHAIEGMSWLQAFTWTCAKSGVGHVFEEYFDYASGKFRTGLRVFVPGWTSSDFPNEDTGKVGSLRLASPAYRTDNKLWDVNGVLRDNNVAQIRVRKSYGSVRNILQAVGSGGRYEVSVELIPFWKYDSHRTPQVDYDPAQPAPIEAAVATIHDPTVPWSKYNPNDPDNDRNPDVLRYWAIPDDEDLYLPDTDFDRPWGRWGNYTDEHGQPRNRYEAFDLGKLRLGELHTGGDNPPEFDGDVAVLRPRPIDVCRSSWDKKSPLPPRLEIGIARSIEPNAEVDWRPMPNGFQVLRRRCGVYIEVEDLSDLKYLDQFKAPGGEELMFPVGGMIEAYLKGLLCFRLTGTIEGDSAPLAAENGIISTASLSRRERGALLIRPRDMELALRDDRRQGQTVLWYGGNSYLRDRTQFPPIEKFYNTDLWPHGAALRRIDRLRWSGTAELPNLVTPVTGALNQLLGGYRPGDEIDGIRAEAGDGTIRQHDLSFKASDYADSNVVIAGRRWTYNPGNGRDQASVMMTQLQLEDPNQIFNFDEVRR